MTESQIPEAPLVSMIREILEGKDLNLMTLKIVRETVMNRLEKRPAHMPSFRQSVKTALNFVLDEAQALEKAPMESEEKDPKKNGPSDSVQINHEAKKEPVSDVKKESKLQKGNKKKKAVNVSEGDEFDFGVSNDEDEANGDADKEEAKPKKKIMQSKRKSPDHDADSVKRKRKRVRIEKTLSDDEIDEDNDDKFDDESNEEEIERPKKVIPRRRKDAATKRRSGGKRERSSSSKTATGSGNKEYDKLNAVLRGVGLRLPPIKLRIKCLDERCEAIIDYLKSKGIDHPVPTSMSQLELDKHRLRLEHEKDMIDIDVRYVLVFFLIFFTHVFLVANNLSFLSVSRYYIFVVILFQRGDGLVGSLLH